jgi:hypothetical protein
VFLAHASGGGAEQQTYSHFLGPGLVVFHLPILHLNSLAYALHSVTRECHRNLAKPFSP